MIVGISNIGGYSELITASLGVHSDAFGYILCFATACATISAFLCAFARSIYTVSQLDSGNWWGLASFGEAANAAPVLKSLEFIVRIGVLISFFVHQNAINGLSRLIAANEKTDGIETLDIVRNFLQSDIGYIWGAQQAVVEPGPHTLASVISTELAAKRVAEVQSLVGDATHTGFTVIFFLIIWTILAYLTMRKYPANTPDDKKKLRLQGFTQIGAILCTSAMLSWMLSFAQLPFSGNASNTLQAPDSFQILQLFAFCFSGLFFVLIIGVQIWGIVSGSPQQVAPNNVTLANKDVTAVNN